MIQHMYIGKYTKAGDTGEISFIQLIAEVYFIVNNHRTNLFHTNFLHNTYNSSF